MIMMRLAKVAAVAALAAFALIVAYNKSSTMIRTISSCGMS